jgi:2-dehydropantoate 2-reductase
MSRVVVIGAGAMGSLFAAHLRLGGAEVWAYDIWREHVAAIAGAGLVVRRDNVETKVGICATTDAHVPGVADIVLIFVKFNHTRSAVEAVRPMIGQRTIIVTLQNGLGNVEIIRSIFPNNRLLFGLTTLTSELLGPGHIEASYQGRGETYFWPVDGKIDSEIESFCSLLVRGGINAAFSADIELRIWKKLIVNCCLNTMCAIADLPVGMLADQVEAWPIMDGVVNEIVAAGQHRGIPLDQAGARTFLREVANEARDHFPSMLIDVRNGKPTEIDCLNGAVLHECEHYGIAAPYNRALYSIIRIKEGSYGQRGTS